MPDPAPTSSGRPVRVAFFSLHARLDRGGQANIARLVHGLSPRAFELSVVAPESGALLDFAAEHGARGFPLHVPELTRASLWRVVRNRHKWRGSFELWRLLRRLSPDVAYVDSVDHVSAVGLAAGGLDTKVVWHVQTTFRSSFDPGAVAAADAIVTVSPAVLARLSGIEPQKRRLEVPNAVDTQRFAPGDDAELRRERGVPPDAPLLLYAGSLEPLKGTLDLVRAFARIHADLPSARLWLVGSAESAFEEPLSRALRESGVASAVDRVGSRSDIERFYRAADLFVFPSHAEGGPLALLEAMASGLACLGSDAPGVKQLLDDGRGRTTPIGDDAAFAREALALLRDRASRQKLAERARAHVLEHHRLDQFVAAFERLFLELTGERRSA